jgi:predicted transcriptional regulator
VTAEQSTRPNIVRIRVTDEELRFLTSVAEEEDRTISAVLRLALRQFAEKRDSDG